MSSEKMCVGCGDNKAVIDDVWCRDCALGEALLGIPTCDGCGALLLSDLAKDSFEAEESHLACCPLMNGESVVE